MSYCWLGYRPVMRVSNAKSIPRAAPLITGDLRFEVFHGPSFTVKEQCQAAGLILYQ
jgi:hypothetical protein